MRSAQREATAYHEAGHAVAAWRLGAGPRSVTIIPRSDSQGELSFESPVSNIHFDLNGSDRTRNRGERAIIICLAGPIAQRRFAPRSWRQWHGVSDYHAALDIALRLNESSRAAKAHLKWLEIRTENLVESSWSFVERVATALSVRGTLSSDEIRSLLLPMHAQKAELRGVSR
jgi:hypothetical protein